MGINIYPSGVGGAGFQLFTRTADNLSGVFADAEARDAYFTANPDDITIVEENQFMVIKLEDNGEGDIVYQQRQNNTWVDVTSIIQGGSGNISVEQEALLTSLMNVSPNRLPIKSSTTNFSNSPLVKTTDRLISDESLEVPVGTLYIGKETSISGAIRALNVVSGITGNKGLLLAQLYNSSGFLAPTIYEQGNSEETVTINAGSTVQNNAQFSLITSKDELITKVEIDTNNISQSVQFGLEIRVNSFTGPIAYELENYVTTDSNGKATVILNNSILVDTNVELFFTVTAIGLVGGLIEGIFVPNLVIYRLPVIRKEVADKNWVLDNDRFLSSANTDGRTTTLSIANNGVLTFDNPIYEDIGLVTGFADSTSAIVEKATSAPFNRITFKVVSSPVILYVKGKKLEITEDIEFTIPDIEGTHFLYITENKTIGSIYSTFNWQTLRRENVYFTAVYWDATNEKIHYVANEMHKAVLNYKEHEYLHEFFGTQFNGGLGLFNFTVDGNGTSDAHAQFAVEAGAISDEDIDLTVAAKSFPANIPIIYQEGVSGALRVKEPNNFPFIGKTDITVTSRPKYNLYSGGVYSLAEVPAGHYFLVHYFALNGYYNDFAGVLGTTTYNNLPEARSAAESEILGVDWIPFQEWVRVGTVIFKTDTFTNSENAIIVSTDTGADFVDFRFSNATGGGLIANPTNHTNLVNRSATGSHPATAISYDNTSTGVPETDVQAVIDEGINRQLTHLASNEAHDAEDITYDAAQSGLTQPKVQGALNEVQTNIENHVASATAHEAVKITFDNSVNSFLSTNTQTAIEETRNDISTQVAAHKVETEAHTATNISINSAGRVGLGDNVQTGLNYNHDQHENHVYSTGAHGANNIPYNNTTSLLVGENVQDAIDSLDSNVDTLSSDLTAHKNAVEGIHPATGITIDTSGFTTVSGSTTAGVLADIDGKLEGHFSNTFKHNATVIDFTPSGNLSALTVDAALKELDTEVVRKSLTETITGEKTFSADTKFSGTTLDASGVSTFKAGTSDKLLVNDDGVITNGSFYLKDDAAIAANHLSGYVGVSALGDYLFAVRSDSTVSFISQERIIFRNSNFTARIYDAIQADTSGGGFTITLPADPGANHPIKIISHVGGNTLTIDGNGHNINVYDTNGNLVVTDTSVTTTANRQWTFRLTASGYQLNL